MENNEGRKAPETEKALSPWERQLAEFRAEILRARANDQVATERIQKWSDKELENSMVNNFHLKFPGGWLRELYEQDEEMSEEEKTEMKKYFSAIDEEIAAHGYQEIAGKIAKKKPTDSFTDQERDVLRELFLAMKSRGFSTGALGK